MIPVEALASVPYAADLPDDLRRALADRLREETVAAGGVIFAEGEEGDAVYLVAEGRVIIQKSIGREAGSFKTLAVMEPGDFFGEMAILEKAPRSATAIANAVTRLWVISASDLTAWVASDPRISLRLLLPFVQALSSLLRETSREMALLYDLGRVLVRDLDSPALAAEMLAVLSRAFVEPVSGAFLLWNEFTGEYEMTAGEGPWPEAFRGPRRGADPLLLWMALRGECVVSEDWAADERFVHAREDWPAFRSVLAAPVPGETRPTGFVVFGHERTGRFFTESHRRVLAGVVNMVSPAFESAYLRLEKRARERLQRSREGLT